MLNHDFHAKASNTVPSDDEPLITCIHALKCKRATMASQMALAHGNIMAQAPHAANAKKNSHSSHIQSMHPSAFARKTSMSSLKEVPPTIHLVFPQKGSPKSPLSSA